MLMFEMLEGRPPFRDPNEHRPAGYSLPRVNTARLRLFQLIIEGYFRFEHVAAVAMRV